MELKRNCGLRVWCARDRKRDYYGLAVGNVFLAPLRLQCRDEGREERVFLRKLSRLMSLSSQLTPVFHVEVSVAFRIFD